MTYTSKAIAKLAQPTRAMKPSALAILLAASPWCVFAQSAPWDLSQLPQGPAPVLTVAPNLHHPSPSGMTVMVETSDAEPAVWVRKKGSTTDFVRVPMQAASAPFTDAAIRFGDLNNLESNTVYEYAVVTGSVAEPKVSPLYAFKTWPKAGDGVEAASFVVIADTQDGRSLNGELIAKAVVEKGVIENECSGAAAQCVNQLAGFVISGDLVGTGSSRGHWQNQFFAPMAALLPYVPLIPAPGNHEYFNEAPDSIEAPQTWASTYRKYFNHLPANGSVQHPLHWYSLDYLGLKMISVDLNPASAMHNTGNWNIAGTDYGRKFFHESYMREQNDWFTQTLQEAKEQQKSHVVLINHHPCLSTKWRQGEVLAACDLMGQIEAFAKEEDGITASLFGHVHAYERGHSMDSRTLWLNVSSASGGLEPAKGGDDSDLDLFVNTRLDHGYGLLRLQFGDQPSASWTRRSLTGPENQAQAVDSIDVDTNSFVMTPTLPQANMAAVEPAALTLEYAVSQPDSVYEAHWQVSRSPDFSGVVFDVWGDATRRENWAYVNGQRINTQEGVDIGQLALGQMLANPRVVYSNTERLSGIRAAIIPGGNDLLERWSCERKWDEFGDADPSTLREGGRQCYARTTVDGEKASPLSPFYNLSAIPTLALQANQLWYWRVRVRNTHLNWSAWSERGRFQLAPVDSTQPDPENQAPSVDFSQQVPALAENGRPLGLSVQAPELCVLSDVQRSVVPANAPANMDFPFDVLSFSLKECQVLGFSAEIDLHDAHIPANAQLWKYDSATGEWLQIDATVTAGHIRYSVTDGGALDEDGQINGALLDPIAIGVPRAVAVDVQAVPFWGFWSMLVSMLGLGVAGAAAIQRNRRR